MGIPDDERSCVQIRWDEYQNDIHTLEIASQDDAVAIVVARLDGHDALASITPVATFPMSRIHAKELLVILANWARNKQATILVIKSTDLLIRYMGRLLGLTGGIRADLRGNIADIAETSTSLFQGHEERAETSDSIVATIRLLGIHVEALPIGGSFRRIARRLSGGVADSWELAVEWAVDRRLIIRVPNRQDLIPEAIASAADTASSILRRFPTYASAVKGISFDRSVSGLSTGRYGGIADNQLWRVHLGIGFVALGFREEQNRLRSQKKPSTDLPSLQIQAPFFTLDAVVAHELWHLIETAFRARHVREGIQLHQALGEHLGVETFEHALKGSDLKAPETWQLANARLIEEVSPYATTNMSEAKAELFAAWWCHGGEPTPLVARFGELLDEFMPVG